MSVTTDPKTTDTASGTAGQPARTSRDLGEGHVMGNLTADPELRFTPSGRAVVTLRLAYTARVRDDASGQWHDSEPEFYTIQVWGQQAENAAECLQRGDRVVAAGSWQEETYTKRDSTPGVAVRLVARDLGASMLFKAVRIQRRQRSGPGAGHPPRPSAPRPAGQRASGDDAA